MKIFKSNPYATAKELREIPVKGLSFSFLGMVLMYHLCFFLCIAGLVIGTLPYEPVGVIPGRWLMMWRITAIFGFSTMIGFGIAALRYYQEIVRRGHEKEKLMMNLK